MPNLAKLLFAAALSVTVATAALPAAVRTDPPTTVVLVHGAFVDGSSWSRVIPLLQAEGLRVIAVQNPLTSLADDVAATRRAIEAAPGSVILVGHSWGGMVITEAGLDDKVGGLVYVAAFALPVGQSVNSASAGGPPAPWTAELQLDADGYLRFPEHAWATYFAQDVPPQEVAVIAATQVPTFVGIFDEPLTQAAYVEKPSWFIVAGNDGAIPPTVQREMATAINAQVTELPGNHVIQWAQPREVADVIIAAANSVR